VVPEKIRLRKTKLGFETPEEHWFKNQGTARLLGMIEDAVKDSDGMLTTDLIALAKHQLSGASRFSGLWWRIIAFDRWRKVFQVQYT
jgi:asparagine synthase (glutamine-hydrolysing)